MIGSLLTGTVAAIHIYIVVLEMVLWDTERGRKAFGMTPEFSRSTKVLAANQGLYNGFLAIGLLWGLVHPVSAFGFQIKVFFLLCVIAAGIYGAISVSRRILFVQAAPAALALILLCLA